MLLNTSALLSSVDPFQETVPNARVRSSIGGQKTLGMNEETSLIEEIKIPLNPGLLCAEEAQQKRKFTFCTEGAEPDVCATFMYDPEWEDILHASRVFKSKSLADDSKVVAAIGSRSLQALQDDVRTPFVETAIAEIHKGGMLHAAVFICSVAEPDDAITLCEKYGPANVAAVDADLKKRIPIDPRKNGRCIVEYEKNGVPYFVVALWLHCSSKQYLRPPTTPNTSRSIHNIWALPMWKRGNMTT